MERVVQDAQVVFTADQAKEMKTEYQAEGYEATYKKVGTGYLVTAYEKEDK